MTRRARLAGRITTVSRRFENWFDTSAFANSLFGGLAVVFAGVLAVMAIVGAVIIGGVALGTWLWSLAFGTPPSKGECLSWHTETSTVLVSAGKGVLVPTTQYENVCDVWQFPLGESTDGA
jgi:hypothetical protein